MLNLHSGTKMPLHHMNAGDAELVEEHSCPLRSPTTKAMLRERCPPQMHLEVPYNQARPPAAAGRTT